MELIKLKTIIEEIKIEGLDKIEIQEFIDFMTKRIITDDVVKVCVTIDELSGMMENDILVQTLLTDIHKVVYLTNIELEDFVDENEELIYDVLVESYDLLNEHGIIEFVNGQLINDDLKDIIDYKIKQKIDNHNSVAHVLKVAIEKLPSMEDIGNIITSLPNEINDLKNLEILNPLATEVKPKPKTKKATKKK